MRSFRSVLARQPEPAPDRLIRRFQSETLEIRSAAEPIRARLTLFALGGLFACLVAISTIFSVDRVVTSQFGQVVTVEPTVVLQALDPSIINTIQVADGERVKKGQLLATLDPTFTDADVEALRRQIASLNAEIARCEAELAHKPFAMRPGGNPEAAQYVALQRNYYDERKAQYDAQVNAYDQQIAQAQATLARVKADEASYADRTVIAKDIEAMRAKLAATQYGSRLNLLLATDQRLEMLRNVQSDANTAAETSHQLKAAVFNRDAFIQQWLGQASQELVTARNQRDDALSKLAKADKRNALERITAPHDAVVLQLAKLSVGSVLKQGDTLMTLALLRSPVQAEVDIDPKNVGFIRVGDDATVKLDAFDFVAHGLAEGKVLWISDGTFDTDPVTGNSTTASGTPIPPYYKARIEFTSVKLRNVPPDFRLIPGMTLTADIHVGTRSLFMYMMRGIVRGFDEAMREP